MHAPDPTHVRGSSGLVTLGPVQSDGSRPFSHPAGSMPSPVAPDRPRSETPPRDADGRQRFTFEGAPGTTRVECSVGRVVPEDPST